MALDEKNRQSMEATKLLNEGEKLPDLGGIQPSGRLVQKEELGRGHESASELDPLLNRERKSAHRKLRLSFQIQEREESHGLRPRFLLGTTYRGEPQGGSENPVP